MRRDTRVSSVEELPLQNNTQKPPFRRIEQLQELALSSPAPDRKPAGNGGPSNVRANEANGKLIRVSEVERPQCINSGYGMCDLPALNRRPLTSSPRLCAKCWHLLPTDPLYPNRLDFCVSLTSLVFVRPATLASTDLQGATAMDPLSFTASVVAVVTTAIDAVQTLRDAVKSYKSRDKTLRRLLSELEDLTNILNSLAEAVELEDSLLTLVQGPVSRCAEVCGEFKTAMDKFGGKAKVGVIDWTKMQFMKGDIQEFTETLCCYKSTISVALGTVTMKLQTLTRDVLEGYSEIIKDAVYDLEMHLRHIDEKLTGMAGGDGTSVSNTTIDLQNERDVTRQCLNICETAAAYIQSLQDGNPVLQEMLPGSADTTQDKFAVQLETNQVMNDARDKFAEKIGRLQQRLDWLDSSDNPDRDRERVQLQQEIDVSRQCLEVCRQVSGQVTKKVHTIGEAVAEPDSDQAVITTLADVFDVKKAIAKARAMQVVGSMQGDEFDKFNELRYKSRPVFPMQSEYTTASVSALDPRKVYTFPPNMGREERRAPSSESRYEKPSPNQVKKRAE
ncbi:hypothetical protein BX600DRAFT_149713 [Xylariales sp. PMI_506]|nr:hypothetical protein BX600DRAFT_149713 [Xylariales sp. PMI_506]